MDIWRLMRSIGQNDISRLQTMLCGCAVTNGATPSSGTIVPVPTANCSDTLVKWACAHKSALNNAKIALYALAAIQPNQMPLVAALSLFTNDLLSVCGADGSVDTSKKPVIDSLVDRICTFDVSVLNWLKAGGLPDALVAVINVVTALILPVKAALASCCASKPASNQNPWPAPPVTSTGNPPVNPSSTGTGTVVVSAPPGTAPADYTGATLSTSNA